jgi:multidrug efflux system membrane fusion protein
MNFNTNAVEVQGVLAWAELNVKSFSVQGVVEQVSVQVGERVKKNQLLAQLDRRSLLVLMDKYKATVKQLDPSIFDAQIEFNNAEELFDRTVLSEIDLQKKHGRLKQLQAQQRVAQANLKLAQIQYNDAQLTAPYDARLVRVDMVPGLVISLENIADKKIILAALGKMRARVAIKVEQATKISLGQKVKLNVKGERYQGRVLSLVQQIEQPKLYFIDIEFNHDARQTYLAGQQVSVEF